jgi:hypothetical protein
MKFSLLKTGFCLCYGENFRYDLSMDFFSQ